MAAAAAAMLPERVDDRLRTRYAQLPVMVRTAGLAATFAFLVAKTGTDDLGRAYGRVADGIRRHLTDRHLVPGAESERSNLGLLDRLANADLAHYTRASAEVEALARWLSRLAEAKHRWSGGHAEPPPGGQGQGRD
jgi:CRISPR type III-B/RAMP module-associated protein Cmr5